MGTREAMSHAALGWVKPELDQLLELVRREIEEFAETSRDGSNMGQAAQWLHQVRGTLRMVELYAPALVAEEMEHLASALVTGAISESDEACATLMRGSVLLPDYLERLQDGHRDIPVVLLPLLNDLRQARGAEPLSEASVQSLNVDGEQFTEQEIEHARGSLSGQNRELLNTVGDVVKEELLRIKEALDLHLRTNAPVADLHAQIQSLASVGDTLDMMGLEAAKGLILEQRDQLVRIVDGQAQLNDELLLEVAGALLHVDATLDQQVATLGVGNGSSDDPSAQETRRTLEVLAQEAMSNFARAREHFVAFIETNWDHQCLHEVPPLLDEVAGALRMLELDAPAGYVAGVSAYIQNELITQRRVPSGRQLDTLADAIASLEYYLEALKERRAASNDILDIARSSLETLRYWPLPVVGEDALSESVSMPLQVVAAAAAHQDVVSSGSEAIAQDSIVNDANLSAGLDLPDVGVPGQETIIPGTSAGDVADYPFVFEASWKASVSAEANQLATAQEDDMGQSVEVTFVMPAQVQDSESVGPAETVSAFDPVAAEDATIPESPIALQDTDGHAPTDALEAVMTAGDEEHVLDDPIVKEQGDQDSAGGKSFVSAAAGREVPVDGLGLADVGQPGSSGFIEKPLERVVTPEWSDEEAQFLAAFAAETQNLPGGEPAVPETAEKSNNGNDAGFQQASLSDADNLEIREVFLEEFEEEMTNLAQLMPRWAEKPGEMNTLLPVRRVFHTLKGSGRLVGARTLGEFSWCMESLLNRVRDGQRTATPAVLAMITLAMEEVLPQLYEALRSNAPVTVDLPAIEQTARRVAEGEEIFYSPSPAEAVESLECQDAAQMSESNLPDEAEGTPASVDSVLLEILQAEVSTHLGTLRGWLGACALEPQPADDRLLRAVHTMSGAFAMTDVPEITGVTASAETLVKRLLSQQAVASLGAVAALDQAAAAIASTLDALSQAHPRIPSFAPIIGSIEAQIAALPESAAAPLASLDPEWPALEVLADVDGIQQEAGQPAELMHTVEAVEADEAVETVDAVEAVEAVEASELVETVEAVEAVEAGELVEAVEAAEAVEASELVETVEAVEAVEAGELVEAVEAVEEAEAAAVVEAVESVEAVEGSEASIEPVAAGHDAASALDFSLLDADLVDIFVEEGRDLLDSSDSLLQRLRQDGMDRDILEGLQRDLHTLKGGARMAGINPVGDLAHSIESLLEAVAIEKIQLDGPEQHLLETGFDQLHRMVSLTGEHRMAVLPQDLVAAIDARIEAANQVVGDSAGIEEVVVATEDLRHEQVDDGLMPLASGEVLTDDVEELAQSDTAIATVNEDIEAVAATGTADEAEIIVGLPEVAEELGEQLAVDEPPVAQAEGLDATVQSAIAPVVVDAAQEQGSGLEDVLPAAGMITIAGLIDMGDDDADADTALTAEVAQPDAASIDLQAAATVIDAVTDAVDGQLDEPTVAEAASAQEAPVPQSAAALIALEPLSAPVVEHDDVVDDNGQRSGQEQVRVRAELLDRLVSNAGEVAIYRSRLEQQLGAFRGAMAELDRTNTRLRDQLRRLDLETEAQIVARYQRENENTDHSFDPLELDRFSTLQQLSRALNESAADLTGLQGVLDDLARNYDNLLSQQSRVSAELHDGLMSARMVPFENVVPRLRRVVRQAAMDAEKQVRLVVEGTHGEMDRNVLDRMVAPLEHMLRNSVAHGIEHPAQRLDAGKDEEGVITLQLRREGAEIVLEVADDGAGLDRAAIRRRAEQRGLIEQSAVLADKELDALIFASGFSTADQVSQLAGRGVGMDVVRNEVRQLGGSVDIVSERGKGASFLLRLPQTLSVAQSVFVQIGENTFAVPVTSVTGIGRISRERFEAGEKVYRYGGEDYQLFDLGTLVGQGTVKAEGQSKVPLLLVRSGDLLAAVAVDQVLGNNEVVVKPVGLQIASLPGIYGATITGDGQVVVILDVAPLVRRLLSQPDHGLAAPVAAPVRQLPLVMVVDDSLTMRKVTGRVLERHNFEVVAARDGIEALERLEERVPDLMLLDIEMPRMDGYELATAMRADERFAGVPIIMITSRTGEKHRQRALEIGVQRYLGKPYQEPDLMRNVYDLLGISRVRD